MNDMIQNEPAPKDRRGGKRVGAGRQAVDGARDLQSCNVTLDAQAVVILTNLGGGNLSAGIRYAARMLAPLPYDPIETEPDDPD